MGMNKQGENDEGRKLTLNKNGPRPQREGGGERERERERERETRLHTSRNTNKCVYLQNIQVLFKHYYHCLSTNQIYALLTVHTTLIQQAFNEYKTVIQYVDLKKGEYARRRSEIAGTF